MKLQMVCAGIVIILAMLACSVSLTNPPVDVSYITQTFSALGTVMAGQPVAGIAQPAGPAEAQAATATEEGCPQVIHVSIPPEPLSNRESGMTDKDNAPYASQHRAFSGSEFFDKNILERPFTATVMEYLADVDIVDGQMSRSGDWVFVTITMSGRSTSGGMTGAYGIEVDNNGDGRGDYLIYGVNPTSTQWTTKGVKAYEDTNKDVGGGTPIESDNRPGNGYDSLVFDQGCINDPDAAWIRLAPGSSSAVQLAYKWSLIKNKGVYLWGAWAGMPEMVNPAWFDYNDHFTHAIAGSPLSELPNYYPLKAFWGWDNTCRWIVGKKEPLGTEPGLCPYTPIPTQEPPPPPIPTDTKYIIY